MGLATVLNNRGAELKQYREAKGQALQTCVATSQRLAVNTEAKQSLQGCTCLFIPRAAWTKRVKTEAMHSLSINCHQT